MKRPHTVRNGVIAQNVNKNGDKYKRQCWDAAPPCVHTRNDILSSQNTIHPSDNRVFSIREVSLMMSVPMSFKWTSKSLDELNAMSYAEKKAFLKKEEMNIRRCLGDAVPTVIFQQIASNINRAMDENAKIHERIEAVLRNKELFDCSNLLQYINDNLSMGFSFLSKVAEMANDKKSSNAAFYTRQDVCYAIMKRLPDAKDWGSGALLVQWVISVYYHLPQIYDNALPSPMLVKNRQNRTQLSILEPAVGVGNFLPVLIQKYSTVQKVVIDVVDIDGNSINILKTMLGGSGG